MPSRAEFSTDRFALKLGLFYAAYFLYGGVQLPFFPLWLESRGLDPRTIGFVIAMPMLVRIVVAPIAAREADKRQALKGALVLGSCGSALAMAVVGLVEGGVAILIAVTIGACFFSPVLSVADAYALAGLEARKRSYGPVRLWGSVAFIGGNLGAGLLLEWIAPGALIWLVVGALTLTSIAAARLVSLQRPALVPDEPAALPYRLLRDRGFILVALAASLIQGSHALYYGFSTVAWQAMGFDGFSIGVLWSIGVLAEIALFAVSARLPRALTPTVLLTVGAAGGVVRWSAMALEPSTAVLPALQVLHALSFGAAHLGTMAFLTRAVPLRLTATAHGAVATAAGLAMAAATALSGILYAVAGTSAYWAMAAMAAASLLCALAARRFSRA